MPQLFIQAELPKLSVPEGTTVNQKDLSLFQKILLTTDGTVTRLIEIYAEEKIKVKKVHQEVLVGNAPPELGCKNNEPHLKRSILLCSSVKNYLYAESSFAFEKLSKTIQYKLLKTKTPIGLLWKEEKVEMYRKVIECKVEYSEAVSAYFCQEKSIPILARTYLVFNKQQPFGVITEKFPITHFRGKK